jgi:uncharacterized membrane protein YfcA
VARGAVLVAIVLFGTAFVYRWMATLRADGAQRLFVPSPFDVFVGLVTDFFDTLGIGSFATTTTLLRLRTVVADRIIPGTLNVGHTIPTLAQALIYVAIVRIDGATLALMIAASVAGAWLGAGVVASWPKRRIQIGLGGALIAAASMQCAQLFHILPAGGDALSLRGVRLALAIAGNFVLGAWMTLGVGLYGPCMVLVSLLGMNPTAAFPIMMGSCALLMPVASARFVARRAYAPKVAAGLTVGGLPGVLVAAWIVRSLPLDAIRWLVVVVVLASAYGLLRSAAREDR